MYEITALIGQGGMGEVYRARDSKRNRDVAIKILPDAFAHDVEPLARFTREAQTLASLNHPNIAHIDGLESRDGREGQEGTARPAATFIVMELVDGNDLSAHIARGAMPPADALPIAKQIADALEAAHDQGIIHKDPRRRLSAIGDARLELDEAGSPAERDGVLAPTLAAAAAPAWRRALPWAVAGIFGAALIWSLVVWAPWRSAPVPAPRKLLASLGADASLPTDLGASAILSPDGTMLAFVARQAGGTRLFIRKLDQLHPDGKRLAVAAAEDQGSVVQDKVVFVFNFFDYLRTIAPRR